METKRCPKCGKHYPDRYRFCQDDAASLVALPAGGGPAADPPPVASTAQPVGTNAGKMCPEAVGTITLTSWKPSRRLITLAGVAGAVLVCGIAGLAGSRLHFRAAAIRTPLRRAAPTMATPSPNPAPSMSSAPTRHATAPPVHRTMASRQEASPDPRPPGPAGRLTEAALTGKSDWELTVMRNEIYARHGYRFRRADLRQYFVGKGWYRPDESDQNLVRRRMSADEQANVALILAFQKRTHHTGPAD